ncbi:MAG TPA: porin [Ramlibacter sp.]|nr:porin [Ramlibacter sp.]
MQRNLIAGLGLALAAGGASAQSSVTIYGIVDAALEHVTNVGASGKGQTRMASLTGSVPSRLGYRGSEDLGGGLRALYTLEMGFSPDSGGLNQGGRVFGRQSFVGLAGPWGSVTLGRQYTMLFWSTLEADVLGPNIHGLAAFDSYIPNVRADNSIAYRGTFGGFTAGATYSLGRDTVNAGPSPSGTNCAGESATDKKACREWSALLKYDTPAWGAALAVDEIRGGPGAFAGLTNSALKDTRVAVNGYAKLGAFKMGAGLLRRDNDASVATPRSDLWYLGASYPVSPQLVVDGQLSRQKYKGSANAATLAVVRATYSLSKRTAVYASAGRMNNDGALALSVSGGQAGSNPTAGGSQTGLAMGIRHSF